MPPLMRTQRSVPNFCAGFVTAKHQSTNGVLASPTDAAANYSKSFLPDEARIMRVSKFVQTICESSASGPKSSWLRGALLLIGDVALLSLTACANQSGANG